MTVRATVEPSLLRWARESLGFASEDAARRVGVKSARVESWERGDTQPTMRQLRELANFYRRPLSVFFLPQPPEETPLDIHDFRRLPHRPAPEWSPLLRLQLRRARERRQVALDLFKELGSPPADFDLSANLDDDPEELGGQLRQVLRVDLATQQAWRQPYEALNGWRDRVEKAGAFVFQAPRIGMAEMRGFSLAEHPLPVIVVNSKDSPTGRIFTMLHELCHITLRRSGICEPYETRQRSPEDQRVEVFCNHVAGATLAPMEDLLADETVRQHGRAVAWSEDELDLIARGFRASKFVVLRRLLVAGRTTNSFYRAKHDEWSEVAAEQAGGGFATPDRQVVSERGRTFVRLVIQTYNEGHITLSDVSTHLGVRLKHLNKIQEAVWP